MYRFLVFITVLILALPAQAQFKKKKKQAADTVSVTLPNPPVMDSIYIDVYRNALKYGDARVAIDAMYHLMALQPNNNSLKDSLALLYSEAGGTVQSVIIGREVLLTKPDNQQIMRVVGMGEQRLGLYKESLASFEKLYGLSKNLYDLYQVGTMQYALQRYAEAQNTFALIITNKSSGEERITISTSEEKTQEVPYRAAAYNLLGVIALEQKEYDEAKGYFRSSMQADPQFVLAKNNLEILEKRLKEMGKSPTNKKNN